MKTASLIFGISLLGGCSGVTGDLVSFTELDASKLILLDLLLQENGFLLNNYCKAEEK